MQILQIKQKLASEEYGFLRDDPNLGNKIILLGLGGSHAYGTNKEGSDLDIRGCALHSKKQILTGHLFEQFTNEETDTCIYGFNKLISLLSNCNPNVIELLGLKPEHYLYVSPTGKELLVRKEMFLSKRAIHTFGGYATQQLYRLKQMVKNGMPQDELEQHILKTLQLMQERFKEVYTPMPEDGLCLYIDESHREDYETEIYMDVHLTHYPVRDYLGMWNEMQSTTKQYNKVGKRNKHAIEHNKIGKHMTHLLRLYMMCIDILEKKEIITYREEEHDLLMKVRNNEYVTEDNHVKSEFYDILQEYEVKFEEAKKTTTLPDNPDYTEINKFVASVNERVVKGEN